MSALGNKEILANNLKYYMNVYHKDRAQVCSDLGFKYSTFSEWISGKKYPRIDKIELLANYFNIAKSNLIEQRTTTDTDTKEDFSGALPVTVKTIPLFKEISCGQPVFAEQDIKSYVPVGSEIEADFCVIANGDSMTGARINDGDIVFIRQTERVNDGEIAAVWIDGEGATLKRVYIQDGILSLVAENPKYKPLFYAEERAHEIRLLGKAVAFQSNVI